jgi:type I restriction enzyme, R subunit
MDTLEAMARLRNAGSQQVRGAGVTLLMTDIVSLIRFALHQEQLLIQFADEVRARFQNWLAQQEQRGRRFSAEQRQWLELIRDHIAANLQIEMGDFDYMPFIQRGSVGRAYQTFGEDLMPLLNELNEVLAA